LYSEKKYISQDLSMPLIKLKVFSLLEKVRSQSPVVHHLTNWVTIYDCAQVVKVLGASPVMAHAPEEVEEMVQLAASLVLNIGTLTVEMVEAMKLAAKSANAKGIPVILDVCGAGATSLRDRKCFELLDEARIDLIKGNASEVARISGAQVRTKGVDAAEVALDLEEVAQSLALKRQCTVVITGPEDLVFNGSRRFIVKNGHPLMSRVVGTGCMATSVIGTFAAVEPDLAIAAAAGLVSFNVAAEIAAELSPGPGTFKVKLFDCLDGLDEQILAERRRVTG
jgi:hydroxyethylthiazole kinase